MPLTRRSFVVGASTALLASSCSSESDNTGTAAEPEPETAPLGTDSAAAPTTGAALTDTVDPFTPSDFATLGACQLLAAAPAGPFPLDEQFDRRDITEGYPGHPLRLGFRVVDQDCAAITGSSVEIWHCDATGDYSAFVDNGNGKDEAEGTTFLRGTRSADTDGIVEFHTIYPGWYPGRAVHIHLTVRVTGGPTLTSQVYFDETYSSEIYRESPYADFGDPDTSNRDDSLAGDVVAGGTLLALEQAATEAGPGTRGLINLTVAS